MHFSLESIIRYLFFAPNFSYHRLFYAQIIYLARNITFVSVTIILFDFAVFDMMFLIHLSEFLQPIVTQINFVCDFELLNPSILTFDLI